MRKVALAAFAVAILFAAPLTYADKLAPPQNTLQPIPENVQPAVSQSVQRSASPTDLQTIQNVEAAEQNDNSSAEQSNSIPESPSAPYNSSNSLALWIGIAIAIAIGGGAIWLWRSF